MRTAASIYPCESEAIQPASWRDLGALRELERVCFPKDGWPLLDLISVLTLPNIMRLKAVCAGNMAGFVAADLKRAKGEVWIATIAVMPVYRRRGFAKSLLETVENRSNLPRCLLNVRPSNHAAIQLYEQLSYRKIDTWSGYYEDGEDSLIYEKVLTG
jgi:ribosomal protein S18 acetylase RimI-like enzyme